MQEPAVEVAFCDLCGTSVPVGDLATGQAVRHQDKTIGACCLAVLRGAPSPAPAAPSVAPRAAASEGRLLPVAIVLLAAIAAATMFVDSKVAGLEQAFRSAQDAAAERQRSDSDVLMGIDVELDRLAQRGDVEAVAGKAGEIAGAVEALQAAATQQAEGVQRDLAATRREVQAAVGKIVDPRPLLEDLRDRQLRLLAAVEALRAAFAAQPAPQPVPEPAAAAPIAATGDLPAELTEQVKRLTDTDPAVRFEAVDVLIQSKNPAVLSHLLPLAKDPDGFVRRLTVEGLRDFPKAEAIEVLLVALGDDDENVRDTAWRSLRDATGQKMPFEAAAGKEQRARAVQRWLDWWEKAKATFGK